MLINIAIPGKIKSVGQYTKLLRNHPKGIEGLKAFFSNHEPPVTLGFHFVRPNKKEFKYTTLINIVVRSLCNVGVIKSEGCKSIMPVILPVETNGILAWWTVDKKKHGVTMSIIKAQDIISPEKPSKLVVDSNRVGMSDATTLKAGSMFGK